MAEAARALDTDLGRSGTLVTLSHARITPRTGRMLTVDAGHGLTATLRADGTALRPPPGGSLPLGVLPGEVWPETETLLDPGDTVIAFSDGLLDLFPTTEDTFDHVLGVAAREPDRIVDRIGELIGRAPLDDDVTVQVIRRCP
jgi:serine phosphatase RsbU (regulator of sigma subunit)